MKKTQKIVTAKIDSDHISTNYRKSLETTAIYHAGKLLADARLSFSSAVMLPIRLFKLFRQFKVLDKRSFGQSLPENSTNKTSQFETTSHALSLLKNHPEDFTALLEETKHSFNNPQTFEKVAIEAARIIAYTDTQMAIGILSNLPIQNKTPIAKKRLGFLLYRTGNIHAAKNALSDQSITACMNSNELSQAARIFSEAEILKNGIEIPIRHSAPITPNKKIMYVCHTSFPHHTNGYAVRTHHIAKAIKDLGHEIECVSRPGYPWDRKDAILPAEVKASSAIDGVRYFRYKTTNVTSLPLAQYIEQAASTLRSHIVKNNITTVIAASNYVNALPALIAARQAGVPFVYDIRGLWEYTSASKVRNWEYSERFELFKRLETLVAKEADSCIAISTSLKEKLISRGINADKISIALNATSGEVKKYSPSKDEIRAELNIPSTAAVLGFIGSIEKYEGLHHLITAISMLLKEGQDVYLLLVGNGSYVSFLHEQCCSLAITDNVRFTGRVSFQKAQNYYAAIDICVYPRLLDKVCSIVPPLKPLEAMAHSKVVIASELEPILELVGGKNNIITALPDDPTNLHLKLLSTLTSTAGQKELINNNLIFIRKERSWQKIVQPYISSLEL